MLLQQGLALETRIDFELLAQELGLAVVLGYVLGWHFVRFAQVLANKRKLARVLPFVCVTTLLLITVVKSSLALSLGLVGAMSIIRFRTPVKEPEELAYLFLAIAVGVGLGADRMKETTFVFGVLLAVMVLRHYVPGGRLPLRTIVEVSSSAPPGDPLAVLLPAISGHCQRVELRRVDAHSGVFHASLLIEIKAVDGLQAMIDSVRGALPDAGITVVEREGLD